MAEMVVRSARSLAVVGAAVAAVVTVGTGALASQHDGTSRQVDLTPEQSVVNSEQCSLPVEQRTGGWFC